MKNLSATKLYALAFGLFLGLCLWKFGNPVILDHRIDPPQTFAEFWNFAWPTHLANWVLLPFVVFGAVLIFQKSISWPQSKWLWLLPLAWLVWQFLAASKTVDADLTQVTLWQFSGCVACYFIGALLITNRVTQYFLFIGILTVFGFCLIRAIDQRVFEYPLEHQMLIEGEHCGWTNFPPEVVSEMKRDEIIITTNGTDAANPVILEKFRKGRVSGTLIYPNALAGVILLLWPVSLALAFGATKNFRPTTRFAAIALTIFLGGAAFFWTGSKLGWLLGIVVVGIFLMRLDWSKKLKIAAVATLLVLGLGVFTVRFHHYFSTGATSVGARFDYWRAAAQTTVANPLFGTGPGTFQRPYAQIKSPESEMARLAHNDYLQQYSDSGIVGGLTYAAWIALALVLAGKKIWSGGDTISFAIFAGVLAWFVQGLGEFGLYIPALAWTAFTLLGASLAFPESKSAAARDLTK
jgi:hypothetical protein